MNGARPDKGNANTELSRAEFISIDGSGMFLKGLNARGLSLTEANFPIVAEDFLVMWELVKAGLGIGILDGTIGDGEPLVRRVLPEFAPLSFPLSLRMARSGPAS